MRTIRYTKEMSKIITIQMRNIRLGGKCHSILTFQNNFLNKMDLLYSQARIWMWVWDILVLGTLGPCDSWTSSLLQHILIFPLHPLTSSYPFLLLSFFGMVWLGGGTSWYIWQWDGRWTFDLYIDLKKLCGGTLGPPPSFYILFL